MTFDEQVLDASGESDDAFASRMRDAFATDAGHKVLTAMMKVCPPAGSAFTGDLSNLNEALIREGQRQVVSFLWRASRPKP